MLIIGSDYHPSFQQIVFLDTGTGECGERRLTHSDGEAERFYRGLSVGQVRVGMEATGHGRWSTLGEGEKQANAVNGTAKRAAVATQLRPCGPELDTRGWLPYGLAQR